MVIKDRRRREIARREQHILDMAQQLIRNEGLVNLQMSRLAEACEYSVGTLYQHFAKKEDLLLALSTRNSEKKVELFERAANWTGPTRERMLAIALADILMLELLPESSRLGQYVCTDIVRESVSPERRQSALAIRVRIERIVTAVTDAAIMTGDLPRFTTLSSLEVTLGLWTQCIGMHTLVQIDGALCVDGLERPYVLLFKQLNHLLNGYGWHPLMASIDDAAVVAQMQRLSREVFDMPCAACASKTATPESDLRLETCP
jgi:AcrR family transcriptional regulator